VLDNWLPVVGPILHARYSEARRTYLEQTGFPWPKRRVRRKPFPGLIEAQDDSEG
jgi:hypothetical protein